MVTRAPRISLSSIRAVQSLIFQANVWTSGRLSADWQSQKGRNVTIIICICSELHVRTHTNQSSSITKTMNSIMLGCQTSGCTCTIILQLSHSYKFRSANFYARLLYTCTITLNKHDALIVTDTIFNVGIDSNWQQYSCKLKVESLYDNNYWIIE